jgi:hypothetical protein
MFVVIAKFVAVKLVLHVATFTYVVNTSQVLSTWWTPSNTRHEIIMVARLNKISGGRKCTNRGNSTNARVCDLRRKKLAYYTGPCTWSF